jgi:hypothetical protein
VGFAEIVLGKWDEERDFGIAAPRTPLKGLEKLQHALSSPLPAEQGGGTDFIGVSGLHWCRAIRRHCARKNLMMLRIDGEKVAFLHARWSRLASWGNWPNVAWPRAKYAPKPMGISEPGRSSSERGAFMRAVSKGKAVASAHRRRGECGVDVVA